MEAGTKARTKDGILTIDDGTDRRDPAERDAEMLDAMVSGSANILAPIDPPTVDRLPDEASDGDRVRLRSNQRIYQRKDGVWFYLASAESSPSERKLVVMDGSDWSYNAVSDTVKIDGRAYVPVDKPDRLMTALAAHIRDARAAGYAAGYADNEDNRPYGTSMEDESIDRSTITARPVLTPPSIDERLGRLADIIGADDTNASDLAVLAGEYVQRSASERIAILYASQTIDDDELARLVRGPMPALPQLDEETLAVFDSQAIGLAQQRGTVKKFAYAIEAAAQAQSSASEWQHRDDTPLVTLLRVRIHARTLEVGLGRLIRIATMLGIEVVDTPRAARDILAIIYEQGGIARLLQTAVNLKPEGR